MASVAFPSLAKSVTLKNGTTYGYIKVAAKPGKPTLLFLHGYPSSSYDWRHQITQVSETGYGMIAPDLLGYGDTDKPLDPESYEMSKMSSEVIDILDREGLDKVVGIGHDWGCGLLSALAYRHDKRFSVFIFMAVGYIAEGAKFADTEAVDKMAVELLGRPLFGYWKFHGDPKCAEILENTDPKIINSLVYPSDPELWKEYVCKPGGFQTWIENKMTSPRPDWITEEEEQMHAKIMKSGGYEGPLNWYKQALRGISTAKEGDLTEDDRRIKIPTLFIGCSKDFICVPFMQAEGMKPWVDDLTIVEVDATHWLMLEKKEEMFSHILKFLQEKL